VSNGTKPAWASSTIWGAIITLIAAGVLLFGVEVTPEEQGAATSSVMQIIGGISALLATIVAVRGRYKADTKIG